MNVVSVKERHMEMLQHQRNFLDKGKTRDKIEYEKFRQTILKSKLNSDNKIETIYAHAKPVLS